MASAEKVTVVIASLSNSMANSHGLKLCMKGLLIHIAELIMFYGAEVCTDVESNGRITVRHGINDMPNENERPEISILDISRHLKDM